MLGIGIAVSNTPQAVNDATANTAIFLMLGALRKVWTPLSAIREGEIIFRYSSFAVPWPYS